MDKTSNYGLLLPSGTEYVTPTQFNSNFTTLDTKLAEVAKEASQVAGHKHSADDITSGLLAEARVPYLNDAERIVATAIGYYNDEFSAKTYKVYTFPWDTTLTKLPKKVYVEFARDSDLSYGNPELSAIGFFASMELMWNSEKNQFDAYTFACMAENLDSVRYCQFIRAFYGNVGGREFSSAISLRNATFNITVPSSASSMVDSRTKWTGYGGPAFVSPTPGIQVKVGGFQYDKNGFSFVYNQALESQFCSFGVIAYAIM